MTLVVAVKHYVYEIITCILLHVSQTILRHWLHYERFVRLESETAAVLSGWLRAVDMGFKDIVFKGVFNKKKPQKYKF